MKTFLKTLSFSCLLLFGYLAGLAQAATGDIEIRLNLIENTNAKNVKELALNVSIINHTDQDVYIPYFENFASFSGVHFYQKEGNIWREISTGTHDYVKPLKFVNGKLDNLDEPYYYDDGNSITGKYKYHIRAAAATTDNIIKAAYKQSKEPQKFPTTLLVLDKPLFLKAHQELNNYLVDGEDYLLTKKMSYKISFNTEPIDSLYHYKDSIAYLKRNKGSLFPDRIFNYKMYFPKKIISNTIYYSTK